MYIYKLDFLVTLPFCRILPAKNSLLSWVQGNKKSSDESQENWSCSVCTLINKYSRNKCSACFTDKPTLSPNSQVQGSQVSQNLPWTCSACTMSNAAVETKCTVCFTEKQISVPNTSTAKTVSKMFENTPSQISHSKKNGVSASSSELRQFTGIPTASSKNSQNTKPDSRSRTPETIVADSATASEKTEVSKIDHPLCPQHKQPCKMQQVHKKGDNYQRMFYTCKLSRGKQCNFFKVTYIFLF